MQQMTENKPMWDVEQPTAKTFFDGRIRSNIEMTQGIKHQLEKLARENAMLRSENMDLRQRNSDLGERVQMAYRDDLTGLPNRRFLDRRMRDTCKKKSPVGGAVYSMLFIDIDDFKKINDTYGHMTGDEILKWVARFLVYNTRSQDICCRLAGDEFIVILPDTTAAYANMLIDRLRRRLEDANCFLEIPVQLSFGSASCPEDGTTVESLFSRADAEMYRDKKKPAKKTRAMPPVSALLHPSSNGDSAFV
ncbi:MAG: GGDEF domain-containing protein [Myxococcota bacterium]|nr:GGDEF domain-containing protein [Myxococcota bacterium]